MNWHAPARTNKGMSIAATPPDRGRVAAGILEAAAPAGWGFGSGLEGKDGPAKAPGIGQCGGKQEIVA